VLSCLSAVAENQPITKHRMNKELSSFAARLRDSILSGFKNEDFDALAVELFALQFEHNVLYQRLCHLRKMTPSTVCAIRGITPSFSGRWTKIPFIGTKAFKNFEISCIPLAQRTAIFHSSGTTEQKPSRHFHNAESLAVYEASLWKWFEKNCELRIANCELLILTPSPKEAPNSSLVHMFETIREKLGSPENVFAGKISTDGNWTLDFDAAISALNSKLEIQNPKLVLGTAFSFVHLLDYLAENNLRFQLPENSRVMETGGYKNRSRSMPKKELHALITERLGVPRENIICEYGMSELSSQAYDSEARGARREALGGSTPRPEPNAQRLFQFPPWTRVQIISPETGREVREGETGLIRVFDLANVFSVAAIQTEDLGIRRGDGFELIGRAQLAEPRGCSLMTA
jgi:Acyl-protein synthetase, LuxE